MLKRSLLAAGSLAVLWAGQARADMPVIDFANLTQAVHEVEQATMMVSQLRSQLSALTNIPANLIGQVEGLINISVANPLQNIMGNLQGLMNGSGTGVCTGAEGLRAMNQLYTALPLPGAGNMDFAGAQINGMAARSAGLLGCTNQMMQATQTRLNELPNLLSELQACGDVTCATAVSGRIQLETATIQAQQQEMTIMAAQGQMQRWMMEDQQQQKMRADAMAVLQQTGGGGGASGFSIASTTEAAPTFSNNGMGGLY